MLGFNKMLFITTVNINITGVKVSWCNDIAQTHVFVKNPAHHVNLVRTGENRLLHYDCARPNPEL